MKASYRWIRALVPDLEASPTELAERFSRAGLAVDGIAEYGASKAVVIAEVRAVEPHPSRAKLRLVTVDRGAGVLQRIVCGAPNVPEPGGQVALAPIGTVLPALGMTLTAREIGGVPSEGMLCSELELGLAAGAKKATEPVDAHAGDPGILVLAPGTAKPGTPLVEALPAAHDWIFDIDLTPNRPDALGHVGLAREAAALYELPFAPPQPDAPARVAAGAVTELVSVTIEDTERCPHYGAAIVADVTIAPSPAWVRYRLESLGIRAISNVVDVTNLILLEFGHPMHAFDLDLVRGRRIVVRRARAGEKLLTLDGVDRALDPDDLVIADGDGPVALAGVMGGGSSEIRPTTKRVLLECAYFWPRGVRRSARRHGLHTESSHRFERGVDPAGVPDVLAHAGTLLTVLAGGSAVPGAIVAGVPFAERQPIPLRAARMRALLGVDVPLADASKILHRLGCTTRAGQGDAKALEPSRDPHSRSLEPSRDPHSRSLESMQVVPPTHRPDLEREVDLIEEVIRVRGLDVLPTVLPAVKPQPPRSAGKLEARVRRAAIEVGLCEAVTYGFVSPKDLEAVGAPAPSVIIKNPLHEERNAMRTSLLPGLCDALRRARRRGEAAVRLFTIGARFLPREDASGPDAALPYEAPTFAAVLAGPRSEVLTKPADVDVYDAKGVAMEIVERVLRRGAAVRHQPPEGRSPHLHPRGAGEVLVDGTRVGTFGPLHPDVVDRLDLDGSAVAVELDLAALEALGVATPKFRPIPVLPAATRDISLAVHEDVTAGEVASAIAEAAGELCESVELFDLYRGANVPAEHRSLAYHVVYRDPKAASDPDAARTLTDEEVDQRHKAVLEAVNKRFGAVLRA